MGLERSRELRGRHATSLSHVADSYRFPLGAGKHGYGNLFLPGRQKSGCGLRGDFIPAGLQGTVANGSQDILLRLDTAARQPEAIQEDLTKFLQ